MQPNLCFFLICWVVLSYYCITTEQKEAIGTAFGDRCDKKCEENNNSLFCNRTSKRCVCSPSTHIKIVSIHRHESGNTGNKSYCLRPARLREECLHEAVCIYYDENSDCIQVNHQHIARCTCKMDYHELLDKNTGNLKCVEEAQLLNSDLATLIGIGLGMTLFCGLTCLVLRIFARARFGTQRHHHYANAHLAPPITLSEPGEVSHSRHSSQRSSTGGGSRRQSSSMLAPPGRSDGGGSRRHSSSSIRSNSSRSNSFREKNHHPHSHHHHHHHHHQHSPSSNNNHQSHSGTSPNESNLESIHINKDNLH